MSNQSDKPKKKKKKHKTVAQIIISKGKQQKKMGKYMLEQLPAATKEAARQQQKEGHWRPSPPLSIASGQQQKNLKLQQLLLQIAPRIPTHTLKHFLPLCYSPKNPNFSLNFYF